MSMPKMTTEKFIEGARNIHGDLYTYKRAQYIDKRTPIEITCRDHGPFWLTMHSHVYRKCGCKPCGDERKRGSRYTEDQIIEMARTIHGHTYDYSHIEYGKVPSMQTKVTILCSRHGPFKQTMSAHIYNRQGCHQCGDIQAERKRTPKITNTLEQFIENSRTIHGTKYSYEDVVYVNTNTPVSIICPSHGPFVVRPRKHVGSMQGCPICGMSRGELLTYQCLKSLNVEFTCQYRFKDCVGLSGSQLIFDFWIPAFNLLIEYDGEQHYQEVPFGKNPARELLNIQVRDNIKTTFARENGIRLLRIPYWQINNTSTLINESIN